MNRAAACLLRTLRQSKGNVGSGDGGVEGRMARRVVGMSRGLRRCTEDDVFASVHFVDRRHPFHSRVEGELPKQLSRVRVEGADLAIARTGEDQTTSGDDGSRFSIMRTGILDSLAASSGTSPKGICHCRVPEFRS